MRYVWLYLAAGGAFILGWMVVLMRPPAGRS